MDRRQVWRAVLGELEIGLSRATFETWFRHTALLSVDEQSNTFVIGVASGFAKDWIEERYRSLLSQTLAKIVGYSVSLRVEVVSERELDEAGVAPARSLVHGASDGTSSRPVATAASSDASVRIVDDSVAAAPTNLNARYTFATYVVGAANRLAHAASLSVAERPGGAYNPLFLYGGTGLGKTHLLHAIGNAVAERAPKKRVLYITGEQFTNEFILGIQQGAAEAFRSRFRKIDVLLIDDIQFLADKERTQEEFFHTFNALHGANKQIVISSDRMPDNIPKLEDRLRGRFRWGLITDIQPPDLETRLAILRNKSERDMTQAPADVLEFIAANITTNIRELEGALIRVTAYASLNRTPITVQLAQSLLGDLLSESNSRPLTPDEMLLEIASYFGLTVDALTGKSRQRDLVTARQVAMYVFRELTDLSYPAIARLFGGRDHTTVIHAVEKIQKLMAERKQIYDQVQDLRKRLTTA